jgi:hypothetical protein
MKFDTFFHGLLTKRDKLGDHWYRKWHAMFFEKGSQPFFDLLKKFANQNDLKKVIRKNQTKRAVLKQNRVFW